MRSIRSSRLIAALVAAAALMFTVALYASGTLMSTRIALAINASGQSSALGLTTAKDDLASDYTQVLANGIGANQASNMFHDRRTLSASATENLDLAGVLTNAFGSTLTFTKIKAVIIHAASTNTNDVLVGGAASNAWVGWVNDATDVVKVKPGGTFVWIAPDVNGGAVVAATGDLLKIANSSSGTSITYDVIIIGVD
jgi:hypothetical protein